MTRFILPIAARVRGAFLGVVLAVLASVSFSPSQAEAALQIPVDVPHFTGTFTVTSFASQVINGVPKLVAIGTLTGVDKAHKGTLNTMTIGGLAVPAAVTTPTCPILHLDLGPLDLDVLGLKVDLSEVVLDITAVPGAGNLLGNLLCQVAGLLDPGSLNQLITLLNQILDLLG